MQKRGKQYKDVGTVAKTNENSGCGIVIKAVDRENKITVSRSSVPLKVGTAMGSQVAGVRTLMDVPDLIFGQRMHVDIL